MSFRAYMSIGLITLILVMAWGLLMKPLTAQTAEERYAVEIVSGRWGSGQFTADLASSLNAKANGRQLVTVVPFDQAGRFLAIYK